MPPSLNLPIRAAETPLLQAQENAAHNRWNLPTVWLFVGFLFLSFTFNMAKPILFPNLHLTRFCNPVWFTWWVPAEETKKKKSNSLEWREKWSRQRNIWENEPQDEREGWAEMIRLLLEVERGGWGEEAGAEMRRMSLGVGLRGGLSLERRFGGTS